MQLDPSPVTDKTVENGVPEQGFEGASVEHKDMETVTGDWGKEYGGKKKVRARGRAGLGILWRRFYNQCRLGKP